MSEKMYPIPFKSLMNWVTSEYAASGEVFGVRKAYHAAGKSLPIFGERIETPFGPAARAEQPTRPEHHRRLLRGRALLRAENRPEDGRRGARPPASPARASSQTTRAITRSGRRS